MPYVITNGVDFVKRGFDNKYKATSNEALADRWDTRLRASKVLGSELPKSLRKGYSVVEVADYPPIPSKAEQEKMATVPSDRTPDLREEMADFLKVAKNLAQEMAKRGGELCDEQSRVDREVTDILHYIEFNSMNACQGYKAYKMLRDTLLRRREIKNEHQAIMAFQCMRLDVDSVEKVAALMSQQKTYKPRELPQLFGENNE